MKQKILFVLNCIILLIPSIIFSQVGIDFLYEKKILQQKVMQFNGEINFVKSHSFYLKKEWDSTLVYSMKQLTTSNNKQLANYCHYFRGVSFFNKKLYKESEKEFLFVPETFVLAPLRNFTLGASLLELKKFELAISYFKLSEKQFIRLKRIDYLADVYSGMGTTFLFLKKYSKAEEFLLKNLELNQKIKNKDKIYSSYTNLAVLYYEEYKDSYAISYFEKAYFLSKEIKDFDTKELASKNMAVVEENRGNFKQALVYRKESEQWKDSLNNQNKVWAIADFEKKFAVAQKQKQIGQLQIKSKIDNQQRKMYLGSAIGLFFLLGGSLYLYFQKKKSSKIILSQKEKLDALNQTKDKLFSIISHDLRSSVNALKSSNTKLFTNLETKNYDSLNSLLRNNSAITNSTYNLLDNLLNWSLEQTHQLYFSQEILNLQTIVKQVEYNYKPLMVEKNITFECDIPNTIYVFADLDSVKIILRNLLDNALKFSKIDGKITIYAIESSSNYQELVIEDTGIGMGEAVQKELLENTTSLSKKRNQEIVGTGLGIQLCKTLIQKNKGIFGIESTENVGTKMIVGLLKTEF